METKKIRSWQFFVPGPLPAQNQLNNMQRGFKARKYNQSKTDWAFIVANAAKLSNIPKFVTPVVISFTWYEMNKRRDPDNISGGGRKFILDALVAVGVLKTDGWKGVAGFGGEVFVVRPEKPGVTITITVADNA